MIITPVRYKPRIVQSDIERGSIIRYFAKHVSRPTITEVNIEQYNFFKTNPYYIVVKLPWIIKGTVSVVEEQNQKILNYYNKRMPGLHRIIRDLLEYGIPTIDK